MSDPAMVTLMDPFHDQNYTPTASGHVMPSVVRQITRTVTINCNQTSPIKSFVIGGLPVGCPSHYQDSPTLYAHKTALQLGPNSGSRSYGPYVAWNRTQGNTAPNEFSTRLNAFTVTPAQPATTMLAPIFILTSGSDTFNFADSATVGATWSAHVFAPSNATANGVAVFGDPEIYRSGPTRIISIAYEVHNVSSALNKQGTCTIGVPPLRVAESAGTYVGAASTTIAQYNQSESAPIISMSSHPRNSGELLVFPGSRQWESAHGTYAIYPPTEEDSSFEEPVGSMVVSASKRSYEVGSLGTGGVGSSAGIIVTNTTFASGTVGEASCVVPGPGSVEPFTPVWSFFEGLNTESVFTITTKITYETVPYPGTDVASLVRYPVAEDVRPIAFKIYRELAPFCFVGENANGKMWRKIAGIGAKIIPVVYPSIRSTVPPGMRFVTDVVAKEGAKALASQANKKKPKSPQAGNGAGPSAPRPASAKASKKKK